MKVPVNRIFGPAVKWSLRALNVIFAAALAYDLSWETYDEIVNTCVGPFGVLAALAALCFSYAPNLERDDFTRLRIVNIGERFTLASLIFLSITAVAFICKQAVVYHPTGRYSKDSPLMMNAELYTYYAVTAVLAIILFFALDKAAMAGLHLTDVLRERTARFRKALKKVDEERGSPENT